MGFGASFPFVMSHFVAMEISIVYDIVNAAIASFCYLVSTHFCDVDYASLDQSIVNLG